MKKLIIGLAFLLVISLTAVAQVQIHSHNDYAQKQPLTTAYLNKVDEVEADIFLRGDSLVVAHSKKEIDPSITLNKLYLHPISVWFKQYGNKVSPDKNYTFKLMIDVKEDWNAVYPVLQREIEKYGEVFKRNKHKNAVQIVISGSRPPHSSFHTYPAWLYFDGLPNVAYAKKDLERITMISDNFANYSKWNGIGEMPNEDQNKLKNAIAQAHGLNKPIRFWAAPDTELCWQKLREMGTDIINTDKIEVCKAYFATNHR